MTWPVCKLKIPRLDENDILVFALEAFSRPRPKADVNIAPINVCF
jgi:hypothetical protein